MIPQALAYPGYWRLQIIRKGVERFDGAIEQVKFQAQSGLTALW
jgi:hypothetical protein